MRPEQDDFSSNRHPASHFCLSMISAQTRFRVCREGKPVPTFPDHALKAKFSCPINGISDFQKNLDRHPKSVASCQPSRLDKRGVSRSSRNVGRDAMDAEVPLTSGAEADGEIVWS
jgi:hypothetical protein